MELINVLTSFINFIKEAINNTSWIFSSFTIGDYTITPIAIISFGILTLLIPIAIAKWIAS